MPDINVPEGIEPEVEMARCLSVKIAKSILKKLLPG
jgi:hypothetical protein